MGTITRASVLFFASALFASSSGIAGVGPEIAYQEQHQNGDEIYLINPDGTGRSLVFKGPSKFFVSNLDMRPGGGELAVALRTRLFIVDYDDHGVKTSSREIKLPTAGCNTGTLDYHPSDGSLLVGQACGSSSTTIFRLAPGASSLDSTPVLSFNYYAGVRWSRSGTKIYYSYGGAPGIFAFDPATGSSSQVQGAGWELSDMLQLGEQTYWNISGGPSNIPNGTYKIGDLVTGQQRDGCRLATSLHFGPNDTQFVFRTLPAQGGYYVMVQNSDCSGAPFRLTGKGAFYYVDWRAP
jgi:hypothetical protein